MAYSVAQGIRMRKVVESTNLLPVHPRHSGTGWDSNPHAKNSMYNVTGALIAVRYVCRASAGFKARLFIDSVSQQHFSNLLFGTAWDYSVSQIAAAELRYKSFYMNVIVSTFALCYCC